MRLPLRISALALLLTAACQDTTGPAARAPSAPTPEPAKTVIAEVLDAARASVPKGEQGGYLIGVLERGATPTSRLVSVQYGKQYELYRFVKKNGEWERMGPIEKHASGELDSAPHGMAALSSTIYPHRIAKIGYDVANWYTQATGPGTYNRGGYWNWYDGTYGQCFPGSYSSGGNTTTLTCDRWYSARQNPSASWFTFGAHSGSSDYICHGYNCRYLGAQNLDLVYTLTVEAAFAVSVSGPTYISEAGEYTWYANPVNGDGNYTYQWQVYSYDSGITEALGNAQSQSMYVSPNGGSFEMLVTVSSAGRSTAGSTYVTTARTSNCPNPTEIICTS